MKKGRFTKEEMAFIGQWHRSMPSKLIAQNLDRSQESVDLFIDRKLRTYKSTDQINPSVAGFREARPMQ